MALSYLTGKGVDQVNSDYKEAIKQSINAGVDMVMVPDRYKDFIRLTIELVNENQIPISRINDAVSRILKTKITVSVFSKNRMQRNQVLKLIYLAHRSTEILQDKPFENLWCFLMQKTMYYH